MIELIGELVPFAVVVAASPLPIIAVLLLLVSPAGRRAGALFAAARIVALAVVVTLATFGADLVDDASGSTTPAGILRIALGLVLIGVAIRKWVKRPRDTDAEALPRWMQAIDTMSPAGALRLGALLTVANLKELAMAVGAGLTLGGAAAELGAVVVAGIVFLVLATLGVTVPVLALLIGRERIAPALSGARDWFVRNNATIMVIVLLAIGALLVGGGIGKLG